MASSCKKCIDAEKYGNGAALCSGECSWNSQLKKCTPMGNVFVISKSYSMDGRHSVQIHLDLFFFFVYFITANLCMTKSGPSSNLPCIFPFTWKGRTFNGCPVNPEDKKQRWCSTKTDSNGNHIADQGRNWGFCNSKCPIALYSKYEKQCNTKYVTEYQKQCHTIHEEKCETKYQNECYIEYMNYVPVEKCKSIPKRSCYMIPKEECKDVAKLVRKEECH